mgnify:CR=1 FL=1
MLGLSSGITSVPSSRVLMETYTADWSSDADGWTDYSGNDANVTLTGNIDNPFGTGKTNCLRVRFNANETGTAGFTKTGAFSTEIRSGDYTEITFNIYIESAYDSTGDGSNDKTDMWNGSDAVYTGVQMVGSIADFTNIAQDEWVAVSTPSINADADIANSISDFMMIYFTSSDDRPKDGARVYIHNFVAKLYRSQLFT